MSVLTYRLCSIQTGALAEGHEYATEVEAQAWADAQRGTRWTWRVVLVQRAAEELSTGGCDGHS